MTKNSDTKTAAKWAGFMEKFDRVSKSDIYSTFVPDFVINTIKSKGDVL